MNELINVPSWLVNLFSNDRFLLPFFSTVGAALTLLLLQFVARSVADKKGKIFAVAYMLDSCCRIQKSALILRRHTIVPHIEAAKRILEGNTDLLEDMFMGDEFDILTDSPMNYDHLSENHKVLLGYDDMELVQMFETVNYLALIDTNRQNLNEFVKSNLKSRHKFGSLSEEKQNDVLNTYWDYLETIDHAETRLVAFVSLIVAPKVRKYIKKLQFLFYSTTTVKKILLNIEADQKEYADLIPASDFFDQSRSGGIQRTL